MKKSNRRIFFGISFIFLLLFIQLTDLYAQEINANKPKIKSGDIRTQFLKSIEEMDLMKAENIVNEALKKNPHDASALDLLGNLHFMKGDTQKSLESYNKAISIDPKYAYTYFDRGSLYLNLEDYEKGLKDMYKAVELDPGNAEFRIALGATLMNLNEFIKAEEHLKKAIQLDSTSTTARFYLGLLYLQLDKEELAIQQHRWILENDPNSFEAQQIRLLMNRIEDNL